MGTTWSVRLCVAPGRNLRALHDGITARLNEIIVQMSTWQADSLISRFNRADAGSAFALPGEFAEVLACALQVAASSDGAFDPTIGPLVALWGFGADAGAQAGRMKQQGQMWVLLPPGAAQKLALNP